MELCGVDIPDKEFTEPIYILSRTAVLSAAFNPKNKQVPLHIAYTHYTGDEDSRCALEHELNKCRMFEFSIRRLRSKEPPIRIKLSFWFLRDLCLAIKSTEDGTWIKNATLNYLIEHPEVGDSPADEWDATVDLPNSVKPLKLIKTGVGNWPDDMVGAVKMRTNLTIYFQPKSPENKTVKKPWTWECTHYQLQCQEDLSVTRINERKLSIQMSTSDLEQIVSKLGTNFFLWDGFQTTEQLFGKPSRDFGKF